MDKQLMKNSDIKEIKEDEGNLVVIEDNGSSHTIPIEMDHEDENWNYPSDVTDKFIEFKTSDNIKKYITDLPPQVDINS